MFVLQGHLSRMAKQSGSACVRRTRCDSRIEGKRFRAWGLGCRACKAKGLSGLGATDLELMAFTLESPCFISWFPKLRVVFWGALE